MPIFTFACSSFSYILVRLLTLCAVCSWHDDLNFVTTMLLKLFLVSISLLNSAFRVKVQFPFTFERSPFLSANQEPNQSNHPDCSMFLLRTNNEKRQELNHLEFHCKRDCFLVLNHCFKAPWRRSACYQQEECACRLSKFARGKI